MIVGVHRLGDEMLRLHEYSPGFDLRCISSELLTWVFDGRLTGAGWYKTVFWLFHPAIWRWGLKEGSGCR
jgi:hypothetical protein